MSESEIITLGVTLLIGVAGVLGTLVAAFLGSASAYQLNVRREDLKQREAQAAAGNAALFALAQQLNRLVNIRNQFIDPLRDRPERALAIQPVLATRGRSIVVDMQSMAFLLRGSGFELCMRLALEQDRFDIAEAAITERSRIHHDEVQPTLEKAGFVEGMTYPIDQIEKMLGRRLFVRIFQATDLMIENVDKAIDANSRLGKDLKVELKRQFPDSKFLTVEIGASPDKTL